MRTKLLFIRHGQTAWNKEGRLQGHTDIPLDETGYLQAQQVARYCAQFSDEVAAIYSSDLQRATQTAGEITKIISKDIVVKPALREAYGGKAEGMTREERKQFFGDNYADYSHSEPEDLLLNRIQECINAIDNEHRGSTVIIVSHAGIIRSLINFLSTGTSDILLDNCCVAEFHMIDGLVKRELHFIEIHRVE